MFGLQFVTLQKVSHFQIIPANTFKQNAKCTTSFTIQNLQTDLVVKVIGGFQQPHK